MKTTLWSRSISLVLLVLSVFAWAIVIWMAAYVSTVILQLLQQIVDLAAISP